MDQNDISNKLNSLLQKVNDIQSSIDSKNKQGNGDKAKSKDGWDKLGIIGQVIGGAIIALAGLLITSYVNTSQLDLENRKQFSDYLNIIAKERDENSRIALVAAINLAVPHNSEMILQHYALNDNSLKVKQQAIQGLTLSNAFNVLQVIADTDILPSKHLAKVALGDKLINDIFARISEIDDVGQLYINGEEVINVKLGDDSDWINITSNLKLGENLVIFKIFNGPYGGWRGRLQLSSGKNQYDSNDGRDNCPCNGQALEIIFKINLASNGTITWTTTGNRYIEPIFPAETSAEVKSLQIPAKE